MMEEKMMLDNVNQNANAAAEIPSAVDINTSLTQTREEKVFTQSQVDVLINERIKRERKVNEALIPVKELLKAACSKGLVKGKSYTEMARDFVDKLKDMNDVKDGNFTQKNSVDSSSENVLENVSENVIADTAETGETSENCGENNSDCPVAEGHDEVADKSSAINGEAKKDNVDKEINCDGTITVKDICALKEKYPNVDMNRLFDNRMFESFAKGKSGSVHEIYDDFCAFLGLLQTNSSEKTDVSEMEDYGRNNEKAVYSTAISAQSGVASDFSDGLTKQQMDIAKSAGMSYREYAYLLSNIPKGKTRN